MTSNPEQYYITYDFKTKGISLLTQEQQNFYHSSLKKTFQLMIITQKNYMSKILFYSILMKSYLITPKTKIF